MDIIPAVADEFLAAGGIGARLFFAPEPGIVGFGALGFGAAVFVFEFERNRAEKAGSSFADITCQEKGADVLADAVVEVGVPALGLLFERLPADKDVERGLAFEDGGEFGLEGAGGAEALGGSGFVGLGVVGLLLNPVAEVAVGQLLQGGVVEPVVVDQGVEAIGAAVPEVPDKRAVVEELGVLLEELVAHANVKSYFSKFGAGLVPTGSLEFMFSRKAVFEFEKPENFSLDDLELELIEYGLESIESYEDMIYVYGDYTNFGSLSKALEEKGIEVKKASLNRIPATSIELTEEQMADVEKLLDKLEDDDDIQAVFTNIA